MWRFIPFYLALIAAPLLFGGVKPESQAVLGILLSLGLILTTKFAAKATFPSWLKFTLIGLFLLPIVPLPFALVEWLSPERARLATEFPIDGEVPDWITLSVSPARSVQRLWELALAIATFVLARRHQSIPGAKRNLAITLGIALLLLGASDLWAAAHGRSTVLGLWKISWGKGYGTFANHNHLANWVFVASLFCIGWIVREISQRDRPQNSAPIIFVAAATLFAVVIALLSASRSGTVAFILGLAVFGLLLRSQFKKRSFAIGLSIVLLATLLAGLLAAEPVLKRLRSGSTGSTVALKMEVWSQTLRLSQRFPVFGAGPGSFVRLFDHYKTAHGDGTFLHAENDFLELPLEVGWPCALLAVAMFGLCFVKYFRSESRVMAGAVAALLTFSVHACVEFVSYVPANLILAASLLGTILKSKNMDTASSVSGWNVRRGLMPGAMLFTAIIQLIAWGEYSRGVRTGSALGVSVSTLLWPWAADRQIAELRLKANLIPSRQPLRNELAMRFNQQADSALQLDPLNWNLRLEQTWFQLAYLTNSSRAISNAWLTIKLNPLQGQIPLQFARHFSKSDPDLAMQFVSAVDAGVPANHRAALDLAWTITRDPAQLWKLTPNTTNAIENLARFASEKKTYALASEACKALEGRANGETIASLYLAAQRPDDCLRVLRNIGTLHAQALRIQALADSGRNVQAIAAARMLFANPVIQPRIEKKLSAAGSYDELLANQQAHPGDPVAALLLAEKIVTMSPPNIEVLSHLATKFPNEPRITYLLFEAQTNNPPTAARTAAELAKRLVAE